MIKKSKWIILGVIFLVISGCTNIQAGDTSKISYGMNQDQVIDAIGKPSYETTNRDEFSDKYETYSAIYTTGIEFSDDYDDEQTTEIYSKFGSVSRAIEEQKNVEVYEYEIDDSHYIIVYFLDNEVSFFYELDLNSE